MKQLNISRSVLSSAILVSANVPEKPAAATTGSLVTIFKQVDTMIILFITLVYRFLFIEGWSSS